MTTQIRFGRKLAIPSTIQIKTDLRMMDAADTLVADAAANTIQGASDEAHRHAAADLAAKHGLSLERARMLVDRYGVARHALEGGAQRLQARKD